MTIKTKRLTELTCLMICLFLVGCVEASQPEVTTFTASPTALLLSPTVTQSEAQMATVAPQPIHIPTFIPTVTLTPTVTPTPQPIVTPSATSVPPILNRQPSPEELERYLDGLALFSEPEPIYGHVVEAIYEDVNGDGEVDLIVSDYLFVGVFLWQQDHYDGAFIHQEFPWKYDPGSRVILEDWTNDGISEIIFDYREDTGGTGYRGTEWSRSILHCPTLESYCEVIWAGESGRLDEGYGRGEVGLLRANIRQEVDGDGRSIVKVITQSFATEFWLTGTLKIYTSTLESYVWNGSHYELQDSENLAPMQIIEPQSVLEKRLDNTIIATMSVRSNNDAGLLNDICQLFVNEQKVGLEFGCKEDFISLDWQDVTGDGLEELVVIAYSNAYTNIGFEGEGYGWDKDCIHQRIIIFQQYNSDFRLIANVTGCVVESDLYGVRFEDVDHDGQVEILAANSWLTGDRGFSTLSLSAPEGKQENRWYELGYQNEVYRWNGSQFVYAGLLEE